MTSESPPFSLFARSVVYSFRQYARLALGPRRRGFTRELTKHRPLKPGDIPAILTARNEASRLPSLFSHYRNLGVTRFLVLDDQSTDGTLDFLLQQEDTSVFQSDIRFREALEGLLWRQEIVDSYRIGSWVINIDCDEYLVFHSQKGYRLPEVFRALEREGKQRAISAVVDMYPPEDIRSVPFPISQPPWSAASHFDHASLRLSLSPQGTRIQGGPRVRLFGRDGNRGKFTLIRWDRATRYVRTVHHPLPFWRNFDLPRFAILHFKFFSDMECRAAEAVQDNQHTRIDTHDRYLKTLARPEPLILRDAESVAFRHPLDLVDAGIIRPFE
jgi:hypothetical protein